MRCIDGDVLIEFIENRYDITWEDDYEGGIKDACVDILEKINKMPIIKPQRKTGKWIVVDDGCISGKCSVCGWESHMYEDDVVGMDYCPNCGARLEGGVNGF